MFAYELGAFGRIGNGTRLPAREIRLILQNSNPWGICSDGEVMWVADRSDPKVFAYDLPPAPSGQITGVTFDEIKEREATITVKIANPDSASKEREAELRHRALRGYGGDQPQDHHRD